MYAMVMQKQFEKLMYTKLKRPVPRQHEILIKISACGICRTDLHIIDGELKNPKLPLIPGHQIIGTIEQMGTAVQSFKIGQRIGVPWLGGSCETCQFCDSSLSL